MTGNNQEGKLQSIKEIFKKEDLIRCTCGSTTFLDWGVQIMERAAQLPGKRLEGLAQSNNVKICTNCHMPVVHYSGDLYDASEFVDQKTIEQVIQLGQATKQPVKAGY